ncbi:hypothetical protein J2782_000629 [Brucella pseudogrignonensis]|uniref:Uncharacterized protein n=1 Tax=Brucella pseudogrignonensis TaxID=419475 RepID=A0ABU1M4H4_9HYPH|nr:hypothetical protein [Brucella pseudogrignonensis]
MDSWANFEEKRTHFMPQLLQNRDRVSHFSQFIYEKNKYAQVVLLEYWA